jgi:hypothetical protein
MTTSFTEQMDFTITLTYSFSINMEDAPPPPLQMAATPICPGFRACIKCKTMRAPDILQSDMKMNHKF